MPSRRVFRQGGIYASRTRSFYRGIAFSGAEYSFANHFYPTQAGVQQVVDQGHTLVRLATKWEYLQPTLSGNLDPTELGKLTTSLNYMADAGLKVILEPHNYGDYKTSDGVTHQLNDSDGVVTNTHFADYWTRVATQFKDHPAVWAYELMNEPRQMFMPYTSSGADLINAGGFETGIPANLSVTNGTAARSTTLKRSGSYSLAITTAAAGNVLVKFTGIPVNFRQIYDFHAYFMKGSATSRNVHVGLMCYDSSGNLLNANEQITGGFNNDGNNYWTVVQSQGTPIFNTATVDLMFTIRSSIAGEIHYLDDLVFVPILGRTTAARAWEISCQAAVDAIRAVDATTMIYLPLYEWQSINNAPTNHPNGPWITNGGNIKYSGHIYLDYSGSGTYVNSYATDNASAVAAGFTDLQAKLMKAISNFTTWLKNKGAKGSITEIGWPYSSPDIATWNSMGNAAYNAFDDAEFDVTYWLSGSFAPGNAGSTTTAYNYYPGGGDVPTVGPQATIIEAHPSK